MREEKNVRLETYVRLLKKWVTLGEAVRDGTTRFRKITRFSESIITTKREYGRVTVCESPCTGWLVLTAKVELSSKVYHKLLILGNILVTNRIISLYNVLLKPFILTPYFYGIFKFYYQNSASLFSEKFNLHFIPLS
jgi:hypothetical protein